MLSNFFKTALALTLASVLVGCFETSENSNPAAQNSSQIRIAMMQPPRTGLSPLSDDAFKLSRWRTAETLVYLNQESIAMPMLATEWTQLETNRWQFKLRENVSFHDGSAFNAKAVVNALTKAMNAAPKPRILDGIEWQIKAINEFTIEIETAFEDPLLPSRLSSPQLAILASSAYQENGRANPINAGTGPFALTKINGQTSASLLRFEHYWGEKAKIEQVFVDYVPNGFTRAAALRTGKVDIVEAIPVSQIATMDPSLLHQVAMPRTNTLYLNNKSPIFSQIALRKIAAEAIDKRQIINTIYEDHADLARGLLGPALAWAEPIRQENVQQESKAFARAQGEKITLGSFSDRAELPEVAVLLKQQLEKAGFIVELDIREYAQIENDALAGRFDAFLLSRATVLDSGDPIAYMQSDFGCQGSFNLGQFCSEEVDAALKYANSQPLGEQRNKAIIAAESKILSRYAAIPILHERVIQGESKRVKNVHRDPRERQLIDEFTQLN